jgi:hypothetical protein
MAGHHVGAVMFVFDDRGTPVGAGFKLYDADNRPGLTLTFRDAERARKGAQLMQQLIDLAETIGP